jgi:hypothetical protein
MLADISANLPVCLDALEMIDDVAAGRPLAEEWSSEHYDVTFASDAVTLRNLWVEGEGGRGAAAAAVVDVAAADAAADLSRTAAYRMAEDPDLPLTDGQFVLGHALLTTTQLYLTPREQDVIRRMLAHHAQQTRQATERAAPPPAPGYRPETLAVLFGTGGS